MRISNASPSSALLTNQGGWKGVGELLMASRAKEAVPLISFSAGSTPAWKWANGWLWESPVPVEYPKLRRYAHGTGPSMQTGVRLLSVPIKPWLMQASVQLPQQSIQDYQGIFPPSHIWIAGGSMDWRMTFKLTLIFIMQIITWNQERKKNTFGIKIGISAINCLVMFTHNLFGCVKKILW